MFASALRTDAMVGLPEQLSVAVAEPSGHAVGLHPRFVLAGQDVNTGRVVSTV